MARKHHSSGRGGLVKHAAAAYTRFRGVRILRKIPVRIENLQQVMKHIARDHAAAAADVEPEIEMSLRMTAGRQNFDEFVEAVRSGHKIGAARFDDRHDTFAEGAEFG